MALTMAEGDFVGLSVQHCIITSPESPSYITTKAQGDSIMLSPCGSRRGPEFSPLHSSLEPAEGSR